MRSECCIEGQVRGLHFSGANMSCCGEDSVMKRLMAATTYDSDPEDLHASAVWASLAAHKRTFTHLYSSIMA